MRYAFVGYGMFLLRDTQKAILTYKKRNLYEKNDRTGITLL